MGGNVAMRWCARAARQRRSQSGVCSRAGARHEGVDDHQRDPAPVEEVAASLQAKPRAAAPPLPRRPEARAR